MMRLRCGKKNFCGSTPGAYSETSKPRAAIVRGELLRARAETPRRCRSRARRSCRRAAGSAPRWLAPSMPVARPLVIVRPRSLEIARELLGRVAAARRRTAAADDRELRRRQQRELGAFDPERERRVGKLRRAAADSAALPNVTSARFGPASHVRQRSSRACVGGLELRDGVGRRGRAREQALAGLRDQRFGGAAAASARRARAAGRLAAPPAAASARRRSPWLRRAAARGELPGYGLRTVSSTAIAVVASMTSA